MLRYDWLKEAHTQFTESFDPESGLVFQSSNDTSSQHWLILGYDLNHNWNLAARWRLIQMKNSKNQLKAVSFITSRTINHAWTLAAESGFSTREVPFFAALRLQYVIRDGPAPE